MDLEKFPTSSTAQKMLEMVSHGFYDDSYIGKWIYQVMGAELDVMGARVEDLPYQAYVDTATWGLRYWEQLYGIETDESLTYAERRAEIHAIEAVGMPINPERIRTTIERFTGRPVEVEEINSEYRFKVIIFQGENIVNWKRIAAWLDKAKPAHLSYGFTVDIRETTSLGVGIVIKETKMLSETVGEESNDGLSDENGDTLTDENNDVLIDG